MWPVNTDVNIILSNRFIFFILYLFTTCRNYDETLSRIWLIHYMTVGTGELGGYSLSTIPTSDTADIWAYSQTARAIVRYAICISINSLKIEHHCEAPCILYILYTIL